MIKGCAGVPPRTSNDKGICHHSPRGACGDRSGLFPCLSGRPDANQHPRWNRHDGSPQSSSSWHIAFTVDTEMPFAVMTDDTDSFIAGHDPGMAREELIERTHERIADLDALRESLAERPRNLHGFARDAYELAGMFHRVRPDAPEVLLFLRIMARAIGA